MFQRLKSSDKNSFEPIIPEYYKYALTYEGLREIPGKVNEPRIVEMYKTVIGRMFDDEVPWCAAFVGHCLKKSGYNSKVSLRALSYMFWGREAKVPMIGDVVVFWRQDKTSGKGHVGFYAGENSTHILVYGGNQGNKVGFNWYTKKRFLEYRRPIYRE